MTPQIHIAGHAASLEYPIGDLVLRSEFGTDQVCGPASATFSMLRGTRRPPAWVVKDAPGQVTLGGRPLLGGYVSEVDWTNDSSVHIVGHATDGNSAVCLTAAGLTTSTPNVAIDTAITNGWVGWTRATSISATPYAATDSTAEVTYVGELLGSWSSAGARPFVGPDGFVTTVADPQTPSLFLLPGTGELSWATENMADVLVAWYFNPYGATAYDSVGTGRVVKKVDLTPLGPMTSTAARAKLNALLAQATTGSWTGGITFGAGQIYGGLTLAAAWQILTAGAMVRLLGHPDPRPNRNTTVTDVISEATEWNVPAGEITLTPRGMVARDWAAILADAGAKEG
ncbi:hypothetical protein [Nocardioides sp.]|uniref:hypothetical protein n=1 Tax=Nocardioides sp. TaxID=35761 RepID=UPI002605CCB1|nr:hypothetical protein [Nocardioides sp.]